MNLKGFEIYYLVIIDIKYCIMDINYFILYEDVFAFTLSMNERKY